MWSLREVRLGVSVMEATVNEHQLTETADLLPKVQPVPLVCDGLQHLLQGAVQLAVVLLRWPDSLTRTGEGRHLRAGIMTVWASSYQRRHRFTAESGAGAGRRGEGGALGTSPEDRVDGEPGTGVLCWSTAETGSWSLELLLEPLVFLLRGSAGNTPHTSCNNTRLLKGQCTVKSAHVQRARRVLRRIRLPTVSPLHCVLKFFFLYSSEELL